MRDDRGNFRGKIGGYSVAIIGENYRPEEDQDLMPEGTSTPHKIKVELSNPLTGDVWIGWAEWDGIDRDRKEDGCDICTRCQDRVIQDN